MRRCIPLPLKPANASRVAFRSASPPGRTLTLRYPYRVSARSLVNFNTRYRTSTSDCDELPYRSQASVATYLGRLGSRRSSTQQSESSKRGASRLSRGSGHGAAGGAGRQQFRAHDRLLHACIAKGPPVLEYALLSVSQRSHGAHFRHVVALPSSLCVWRPPTCQSHGST